MVKFHQFILKFFFYFLFLGKEIFPTEILILEIIQMLVLWEPFLLFEKQKGKQLNPTLSFKSSMEEKILVEILLLWQIWKPIGVIKSPVRPRKERYIVNQVMNSLLKQEFKITQPSSFGVVVFKIGFLFCFIPFWSCGWGLLTFYSFQPSRFS